jgi:hypothetical protein
MERDGANRDTRYDLMLKSGYDQADKGEVFSDAVCVGLIWDKDKSG